MTHEFKIEITRDGRWWMIHIPDISGVTQVRRLAEAETMAREFIALDQAIPYNDIKINIASIRMTEPEFRELLETAQEIKDTRARAQELERQAVDASRKFAQWLTTYGVPVRDIAELLDVSPQRISQLANQQT